MIKFISKLLSAYHLWWTFSRSLTL